jgi:hypothetical protein
MFLPAPAVPAPSSTSRGCPEDCVPRCAAATSPAAASESVWTCVALAVVVVVEVWTLLAAVMPETVVTVVVVLLLLLAVPMPVLLAPWDVGAFGCSAGRWMTTTGLKQQAQRV